MGEQQPPESMSWGDRVHVCVFVAFWLAALIGIAWLPNEQSETDVRRSVTCVDSVSDCSYRAEERAVDACNVAASKDEGDAAKSWDHYQVRVTTRWVRAIGVTEPHHRTIHVYFCEDFPDA